MASCRAVQSGDSERSTIAAVAAIVALAAVLRFWRLGHQGFWFDEGNTALLVARSPGRMLSLIPQTESTPPLYYCLAWLWSRVFGHGEAGLRSLSATAGVLTVPVAWATGRELFSSARAGLVAAALTACNPLLIWYSQEARSYALLVLLTAVALLGFIRATREPSRRALVLWAAGSCLALLTHYYAIVAVAPQVAWLVWTHRRSRPVLIACGVIGVCGLALVPLALSQNATGHDSWIAMTPLHLRIAQILPQFMIGTGAPARTALKFAAFALCAAALGLAAAGKRSPALLAGGLAIAGFVLSLVLTVAFGDSLLTRNLLGLWLPGALCVTGGLTTAAVAWRRRLGGVIAAALCAIGVTAAIGVATDYDLQRPDWRSVVQALAAAPAPDGSRVILIQHFKTLLPLSLYLHNLRAFHGSIAHGVAELDVIGFSAPQQPLCWWGSACNLIPSEVQASYPIAGFRQLARLHVHRFTIVRLVAARPVLLTRAAVSAALRTTALHHDELLIQRRGAG